MVLYCTGVSIFLVTLYWQTIDIFTRLYSCEPCLRMISSYFWPKQAHFGPQHVKCMISIQYLTSPLASPSSDSEEESAMREGGRERPWWGDGEGVLVSSSLSTPGTRNEAGAGRREVIRACRSIVTSTTTCTSLIVHQSFKHICDFALDEVVSVFGLNVVAVISTHSI